METSRRQQPLQLFTSIVGSLSLKMEVIEFQRTRCVSAILALTKGFAMKHMRMISCVLLMLDRRNSLTRKSLILNGCRLPWLLFVIVTSLHIQGLLVKMVIKMSQ